MEQHPPSLPPEWWTRCLHPQRQQCQQRTKPTWAGQVEVPSTLKKRNRPKAAATRLGCTRADTQTAPLAGATTHAMRSNSAVRTGHGVLIWKRTGGRSGSKKPGRSFFFLRLPRSPFQGFQGSSVPCARMETDRRLRVLSSVAQFATRTQTHAPQSQRARAATCLGLDETAGQPKGSNQRSSRTSIGSLARLPFHFHHPLLLLRLLLGHARLGRGSPTVSPLRCRRRSPADWVVFNKLANEERMDAVVAETCRCGRKDGY